MGLRPKLIFHQLLTENETWSCHVWVLLGGRRFAIRGPPRPKRDLCLFRAWEEILVGFRSRRQVQELIYLSEYGDQCFKHAVCDAIRDMLGDDLVPTLGQILQGPYNDSLEQISIEILGEQGRRAEVLLPDLIRMLKAGEGPGAPIDGSCGPGTYRATR